MVVSVDVKNKDLIDLDFSMSIGQSQTYTFEEFTVFQDCNQAIDYTVTLVES